MSSSQDSLDRDRSQSVRRFYRLMARIYDPIRRWWSKRTSEAESELDALFAKNIRSDSRILELGPGTGVNLTRLYRVSPEFQSYLGIDLSKEMLSRATSVMGSRTSTGCWAACSAKRPPSSSSREAREVRNRLSIRATRRGTAPAPW